MIGLSARRARRLAAPLAAAALMLAACGPQSAEPTLVVMESRGSFLPATVIIPAGTTVIWRNEDRLAHTVTGGAPIKTDSFVLEATLPAGAEPFDSGYVFAGRTWAPTFETPGQYVYYCRYHAQDQMVANVVVEAVP